MFQYALSHSASSQFRPRFLLLHLFIHVQVLFQITIRRQLYSWPILKNISLAIFTGRFSGLIHFAQKPCCFHYGNRDRKKPIIFINGGENVNHVSSKKNNVGYNVSNVCDDPQLNSLEPITETNFLQRQSKFI